MIRVGSGSSMMATKGERAQTAPGCTWTKTASSKTAWYSRAIRHSSRRHSYHSSSQLPPLEGAAESGNRINRDVRIYEKEILKSHSSVKISSSMINFHHHSHPSPTMSLPPRWLIIDYNLKFNTCCYKSVKTSTTINLVASDWSPEHAPFQAADSGRLRGQPVAVGSQWHPISHPNKSHLPASKTFR